MGSNLGFVFTSACPHFDKIFDGSCNYLACMFSSVIGLAKASSHIGANKSSSSNDIGANKSSLMAFAGLEGEMLAGIWGPVLAAAFASAEAAWSPDQLQLPMQVRAHGMICRCKSFCRFSR